MAGELPVTVNEEQKTALEALASSRDRCEADRARASQEWMAKPAA